MNEPRTFRIEDPLPAGVTVLEASAGTGKTYAIAALAARYIAEGRTTLERMLLVTFTRAATGELRERVRDRLIAVERGLSAVLAAPDGAASGDPVVALLAAGGDVRAGRDRLTHAVAGFDAATIATTHGFCQEMLQTLGVAGDLEPDVTLAEDLSDLRADVTDDRYVKAFRTHPPAFDRDQAGRVTRIAIANPTAPIAPVPDDGDRTAKMRRRLAEVARREFDRRKRLAAVMSYDDLVTRLRETLSGEAGEAARAALRGRYDVVLVDEFQDTDPDQWEILKLAFADPGRSLVLIADPKQAIYAFRGADVYAYLAAAATADDRATLRTNWRCDQALIDAHDALFGDARLGHAGIVYRRVQAAEGHAGSRLAGAPDPAAMRFRVLMRDHPELTLTKRTGCAEKGSAERLVADDLAADVVALLHSDATAAGVPIAPGHLAALVRTNRQAVTVQRALERAGVPAVINGAGSVFATDAAREWLRLIEALERPASIARAHSAALTAFIGWPADRLAASADDDGEGAAWEEVHRRLHDWSRVLRTRGVAALLQTITVTERLAERMLGLHDGERRLTDVRHIGQVLHGAATAEQLGPTALAAWLRGRIAEADAGDDAEERSRRLESDAEAVQVLTIHRSKGLEFPIVYCPYAWDGREVRRGEPVLFHDPARGDERTVDVSLTGPGYGRHLAQHTREERGGDLRLLYVALTRARHQVVLWWAGSWGSRWSPLGRLLFARDDAGVIGDELDRVPDDLSVLARLGKLVEAAPPQTFSLRRAGPAAGAHWSPPPPEHAALSAARWHRRLDLRWRRTSYTDMTAASYDAWVASEPEEPLIADEPAEPEWAPAAAAATAPRLSLPSPLAAMGVGADVGTVVHRALQATDFAAADLDAELRRALADAQARRSAAVGDPAAVCAGLRAAIETPLGPVLDDLRLRDVARADRLDELGFELPLAGGDRPHGTVTPAGIAAVLRDALPARDPLRAYAERLRDPWLRQGVRGYLTGSLDLVVRLPGDARQSTPRFAVIDYKTNWLGDPGEPLTTEHYRPEALAAEMARHHYLLQALLYTVALHRFLRWRLPGYDPGVHIAGVAYLFVRGMAGDDRLGGAGNPSGVFTWRPPAALAPALSDALDAGDAVG